jgi:hypothetical protein
MEAMRCPTLGRGGQTSRPLAWMNLAFWGRWVCLKQMVTPQMWRELASPIPSEAHTYFLDTTRSCVGDWEDMLF